MSNTLILKLGGSVLTGEADVAAAVHEIYRHVRRGTRVVAVVSALHGATDRLLARAKRYGDEPFATASLVATGEQTSAALLALSLDRAGVPVETLDAIQTGLRSTSEALDAAPISVDAVAIRRALERVPVAVVPGFIARDERGRTTLLGRGGSDLTALFLARVLDARCRLVKDVPGIFTHDPRSGAPARLYERLHWDTLCQIGGRIVQPKTATFARDHRIVFEVGAILNDGGTRIGDSTALAPVRADVSTRPLRVALLGHGTVGRGVATAIRRQPDLFTLQAVAVRTPDKHTLPKRLVTTDAIAAACGDVDVVIEAIGGIEPARSCIEAALRSGKHVVTANKAVINAHGVELEAIAMRAGGRLLYSAAVGGAVPVLESLSSLITFEGVLNGTTNFILDRVADGIAFEDAVREAQDRGLAEADPSRDLDGQDAEDKLRIIARRLYGDRPFTVRRQGVTAEIARVLGLIPGVRVKQVARIDTSRGDPELSVLPEAVPLSHPLAQLKREENGVVLTTPLNLRTWIFGKGAGRWPSTESVIADLIDLLPATATRTQHTRRAQQSERARGRDHRDVTDQRRIGAHRDLADQRGSTRREVDSKELRER